MTFTHSSQKRTLSRPSANSNSIDADQSFVFEGHDGAQPIAESVVQGSLFPHFTQTLGMMEGGSDEDVSSLFNDLAPYEVAEYSSADGVAMAGLQDGIRGAISGFVNERSMLVAASDSLYHIRPILSEVEQNLDAEAGLRPEVLKTQLDSMIRCFSAL